MQQIKKKHRKKSSLQLAKLCVKAALEKKAEAPLILDVRKLCSFADYFVILSGRSTRHVQGLAEAVEEELRSKRVSTGKSEGLREGNWVLLDYNDVIVHIFYADSRKFYDLEGLWHDAKSIKVNE